MAAASRPERVALAERIRAEADIAARPGQLARLNQIADEVSRMQHDAWVEGLLHGRHFPWATPDDSPHRSAPLESGDDA